MQKVVLNNGVEMPILGYGVFLINDKKECEQCVVDALETGYRLIDTAAGYANEDAVGNGIKHSGIPREEIFVTTKLAIPEAGYENTKQAFERSLNKLQLNYLDLYLIHMPYGNTYGSWRAMEELYRAGRIRAIGVSTHSVARVLDLKLHNQIAPAVSMVETHPFFQQNEYAALLKESNIQMEAWGPLAQGNFDIFNNEVLMSIGKKYGKSVSQVTLRWLIQRGIVAIPKSVHKNRMAENFNIFDFELSPQDISKIASLDTGKSIFHDLGEVGFMMACHDFRNPT